MSRDKAGVLALAQKGHEITQPADLVKDPLVLEFTGLRQDDRFHESDLEQALLARLQQFLLELGKGFAFMGRQQRITLDRRHFFIDLVFYNRITRSFVLLDLLCGRPHKRSNVAKLVMWRRPEQPPVPSNRILVECHISYRV
ncbi:MAG: PDDEXK nuclease domain-containing protein, partial [Isosphaeraceae bacterium]